MLIRIEATSVNPVDGLVASGFFAQAQEYRYPAVFGRDLCGVVEEAGKGVTRLQVGDRVWGFIKREYVGNGTFAEYVTCSADQFVIQKPAGISVLGAGSMGLAGVTALECIDVLELERGDTVFINRATGGIGSFAVQIAAARGLRVVATARPGPAADQMIALGADATVDWTTGDLAAAVRAVAPDGVSGIVDLVRRHGATGIGEGKAESQASMRALADRLLRPGGRFSSTTNDADDDLVARGIGYNVHSTPSLSNLGHLNELISTGHLNACVARAFPFSQIADAFAHQQAHGCGKVAIAVVEHLLEDSAAM
ncbi:MAG: NADP-dependent oxidoreductase [Actinomycetota bacterium]|nr:NADP-dependent oxidoreductase [Actinomycetota bacterium]